MPPRRSKKSSGGSGVDCPTSRLQEQIKEGQTYEALQTARAVFARLEGQKKGGQARTLALDLAKSFAEAKEFKSALDLARLYMENNSTSQPKKEGEERVMEVSAEEAASAPQAAGGDDPDMQPHRYAASGKEHMLALATQFPAGSSERLALLKGLTRWAMEETGQATPDLALGLELASAYKEMGAYGQAARKYAQLSSCVEGEEEMGSLAATYVALLEEWSQEGYKQEKDLFLARAILHLLSSSSANKAVLAFARALLQAASASSSSLSSSLEGSPLVHFVGLLLDLLEHRQQPGAANVFKLLTVRYELALERDPDLRKYVGKIAEGWFGLMPPPNPMQALLSSMMGGGGGGGGGGMGGLLGSMLGGGAGGGGGLLGSLGGLGL